MRVATFYELTGILPEYAVPIEIRFEDPHSDREYFKSVVRDTRRNRFVAYLECRSSYGLFDFVLEARFRRDEDNFPSAKYRDEYTTKPGTHVHPYKRLVPADSWPLVHQFLSPSPTETPNPEHESSRKIVHVPPFTTAMRASGSGSPEPPQLSFPGIASQQQVIPSVILIKTDRLEIVGGGEPQNAPRPMGSKPKLAKLPPKRGTVPSCYDQVTLTERQREVIELKYVYELTVTDIAAWLGLSRKTIDEHIDAADQKVAVARTKERKASKSAHNPE